MTHAQPNSTSTPPVDLLTSGEVAEMFDVDRKTVIRWALTGSLPSFKTPGGHRRFYRADIQAWLTGGQS